MKLQKYILHVFVFLLPLLFTNFTFQRFEITKVTWFFIVGIGILGLLFAWEVFWKKEVYVGVFKNFKGFWIALGLLFLYTILNTVFFSIEPGLSFWGNAERHQGLVMYGGLSLFFLYLSSRKSTLEEHTSLLRTVVVSGVLVSILGLAQKLVPGFIGDLDVSVGRVFSTMGHPNFLGEFLIIPVLLCLYFVLRNLLQKKWIEVVCYSFGFILTLLTLFLTINRASIVAAGIGIFGMVVVSFVLYAKEAKHISAFGGLTIGGIALGLLGFLTFHGEQLLNLRSVMTRIELFPQVLEVIKARPLFGYGLDTFQYAFSPFYKAAIGNTEIFTHLPDKAHNGLLDLLMELGVVGLVLITVPLVLFLVAVWKYFKEGGEKKEELLEELLFVATCIIILISLMIPEITGFATTTTKILMAVILAIVLSVTTKDSKKTLRISNTLAVFLPLFAGVLSIFYMYIGSAQWIADMNFNEAMNTNNKEYLSRSIELSPYPHSYAISGVDIVKDAEEKVILSEIAIELNESSYLAYLQKAKVLSDKGEKQEANTYFKKSEKRCPECPLLYYHWTEALMKNKDIANVMYPLGKYFELLPSYMKKIDVMGENKDIRRLFLKQNKDMFVFMVQVQIFVASIKGDTVEREKWDTYLNTVLESLAK